MSTAAPPRRQAALKAEELNRVELERGMQEEEGEAEDSDYVSDEEDLASSKKKRRRYEEFTGVEQGPILTEMAKQKAAEMFNKLLPSISQQAKQTVGMLLREDRDEGPENPKAKQIKLESFVDPMLVSYVAQPKVIPDHVALAVAEQVLKSFGTATIQEKVKFAGQEVEVQKKVDKTKLIEEQEATKSSLDTYIQGISKKQGITTVEKSSYDWEKYKEEKNLKEELQDASKAGFVEKQAFLSRVDERQFEKERAIRERERAIREASQPQKPAAD